MRRYGWSERRSAIRGPAARGRAGPGWPPALSPGAVPSRRPGQLPLPANPGMGERRGGPSGSRRGKGALDRAGLSEAGGAQAV